jgi:hypothetical protein
MMNVLMGVIGVILFVGLAIAGALFMGDQFSNAGARTNAAVIVGQLQQMTQALEMYRLKTGIQTVNCQTVDFLVPRFLKVVPVSPTLKAKSTTASYMYRPQLNNDLVTDETAAQAANVAAAYITTNLGDDITAKKACQAIADLQSGGLQSVELLPTKKGGCGFYAGEYVAWHKL